ncbi:hypothetical protein [Actibacterium pelagium]|nr:hypothetical protein [Actibacterium pelagium]
MKFAYHFGAHCTDEDRLLKCLFKNRGALGERSINVSGPGRYRAQLRAAVGELRGEIASDAKQDELLDDVIIFDNVERVIFSHSAFLGSAGGAVGLGRFYPKAGELAQGYARLFPQDHCEFFIAVRDPATYFPAIFKQSGEKDFEKFMMGIEPINMYWSETISRIRRASPGSPLIVWANEDSPVIWHDILNRFAGIGPDMTLRGSYDFPASLMSEDGVQALASRLKTDPPKDAASKRALLADMLDTYGRPDAMEEEIDLPHWSQDLINALTEAYEEDLERIAKMEGVTFLTP